MIRFWGEKLISEFKDTQKWLHSKGFNAYASRYKDYIKDIDAFFAADDPTNEDGRNKFELLTKSFQECIEIVLVKNAFEDETNTNFLNKLNNVVSGNSHLAAREPSKARNYLFELLVAARFKSDGWVVNFDRKTDVVVHKGSSTLFVECKRITSERGFEACLKKAYEQLDEIKNELKKGENLGMIFIDILPLISDDLPKTEVANIQLAELMTDSIMNSHKRNLIRFINKRLESKANQCGVVCLTASIPVWLKDEKRLVRLNKHSAIIPKKRAPSDFARITDILIRSLNKLGKELL